MQVEPWRRPFCAAVMLVVLMLSGCGQKGPLYQDNAAPQAESAAAADQAIQASTQADDEAPPQR